MDNCTSCKRKFPEGLVQPMYSSSGGKGNYRDLCPICALIIRNESAGLPIDTPFSGEIANELFERAYAYAVKQGWIEEEPVGPFARPPADQREASTSDGMYKGAEEVRTMVAEAKKKSK